MNNSLIALEYTSLCRAEQADGKEWLIGYYVFYEPPLECISSAKESGQHLMVKTGFADWSMPRPLDYFPIKPNTICRCSGLSAPESYRGSGIQDLLVFSGDILSFLYVDEEYPDESMNEYVEVIYENGCFSVNIGGDNMTPLFEILNSERNVKIVGTIFETPELLN